MLAFLNPNVTPRNSGNLALTGMRKNNALNEVSKGEPSQYNFKQDLSFSVVQQALNNSKSRAVIDGKFKS